MLPRQRADPLNYGVRLETQPAPTSLTGIQATVLVFDKLPTIELRSPVPSISVEPASTTGRARRCSALDLGRLTVVRLLGSVLSLYPVNRTNGPDNDASDLYGKTD
jgi:hypothetical protein